MADIPRCTVDIGIRHTLLVNHVLDCLRLEGKTEVKIKRLVADAVVTGPRYVEVDRSNSSLKEKAARYRELGPVKLLIVTHRTSQVEKAFAGNKGDILIVPTEALEDSESVARLRQILKGS